MNDSTVALLMTDVVGSTRQWAQQPAAMNDAMRRHHEIVHGVVHEHRGRRPTDQGEGDAVFAAFDSATDAVDAALVIQQRLAAEPWPAGVELEDRIAVHAGEVIVRDGNLFGTAVNRCARLRSLASGGQVLVSAAAFELVADHLRGEVEVADLGEHRMKDLDRPERVRQLSAPGMRTEFPPLKDLDRAAHNLPAQRTPFIGREDEVARLRELVAGQHLTTVVGFGGMGKTRLALQVGAESADGDGDGVWFVDLAPVIDPSLVASTVAEVLGVQDAGDGVEAALIAELATRRTLLILDNLEQLLPAAAETVDRLARSGPGVRVLVTSREPLHVRSEQVFGLSPLPAPAPLVGDPVWDETELADLAAIPAVALFIGRARAVHHGFRLSAANAGAVAAICARLEGLPLALELAAARLRVLRPEALLLRLDDALNVLTGGSRDLPARQQTLRSTIAWSIDGLTDDEQQLLARLSVFPGSFTLDAAEAVAGVEPRAPMDVLDGVTVLLDRSLLRQIGEDEDRMGLLVPIREYAALLLSDTALLRDSHAEHYRREAAPASPWTAHGQEAHGERVAADLHNLRLALTTLHDRGRTAEERALAADVSWALVHTGAATELAAFVDHALAHDRPTAADAAEVVLARAKSWVEHWAGRGGEAARWGCIALAAAREADDPSLLVLALERRLYYIGAGAERDALLAEGEGVLALPPRATDALARELVQQEWDRLAVEPWFMDDEKAEAMLRRRVAQTSGADQLHARQRFALRLFNHGRAAEAAVQLEVFDDDAALSALPLGLQLRGTMLLAVVRVVLGRHADARTTLEHLQQRLSSSEYREMAVDVRVLQAAVDRALGDRDRARTRLADAVRAAHGLDVAAAGAYADWLLAVLAREDGEGDAAARHLADAWAVARLDTFNVDLVLQCLLERAVQVLPEDPADAARLLGLVEVHRHAEPFYHAVDYDLQRMRVAVRAALPPDAVERLLSPSEQTPVPRGADFH